MKLIKSLRYLPSFMRDFHDQKDLFKSIGQWNNNEKKDYYNISWTQGHVYVIDIFLHFMALHGYVLKKSETKEEVYNIYDTLKLYEQKRIDSFKNILTPLDQ